jgi:uncharacterized protein (TIRG00374 family)
MSKFRQNGFLSLKDFDFGRIFKPLAVIIPLAIAADIIYVLASSKLRILGDLIHFHIFYLVLAAALVLVPWFSQMIRLIIWSRAFKKPLHPVQALQTAIVTELGNALTPTSTGGGYFKLGFLIGYGFAPGQAALLTFLGTIEDAVFFAIALPLSLILSHAWNDPYVVVAFRNLTSHWPVVTAIIGAIIIAYLVVFKWKLIYPHGVSSEEEKQPSWIQRIRTRFYNYLEQFFSAGRFVLRNGKTRLGLCTILSGIGWCCRYGAISALVLGLGYKADPVLFFLLQWVVFSTMILVPTPGAIGGAEFTFGLVFSGAAPAPILPVLIGAWRFVTFYMLVSIGSIFMAVTGTGLSARRFNGRDEKVLEEVEK